MAVTLALLPGNTIRWRGRFYVIVDYAGLDEIIAREPGRGKLQRIPVTEVESNHLNGNSWAAPDLVSVREADWQEAVRRFEVLKPLLAMEGAQRRFADVKKPRGPWESIP
jgi:putative transposase